MKLPGSQFQQLPLFMSGQAIKDTFDPNPADVNEFEYHDKNGKSTEDVMWDNKSSENDYSITGDKPLYRSVREHGVQTPIDIEMDRSGGTIRDGHHRVQAAAETGTEFVPIDFH